MRLNSTNISAQRLYDRLILTAIALFLGILALRPLAKPEVASAQAAYEYLYFEPGTMSLRAPDGSRQVEGKMAIDLRNGNIWGFPTLSSSPYPIDATHNEPPVSAPFYLGRFDLSKLRSR